MSARASFAAFLEAAGPGPRAERHRAERPAAAVEAPLAGWSGAILGPDTTPEAVEAALGPADTRDGRTLRYALPTRPGFSYAFEFTEPGRRLARSGFRRDTPLQRPALSDDSTTLARQLASVGATAEEVLGWLGAPARTFDWWPVEVWEYPHGLVVELRHGVVEDPEA